MSAGGRGVLCMQLVCVCASVFACTSIKGEGGSQMSHVQVLCDAVSYEYKKTQWPFPNTHASVLHT